MSIDDNSPRKCKSEDDIHRHFTHGKPIKAIFTEKNSGVDFYVPLNNKKCCRLRRKDIDEEGFYILGLEYYSWKISDIGDLDTTPCEDFTYCLFLPMFAEQENRKEGVYAVISCEWETYGKYMTNSSGNIEFSFANGTPSFE